MAYFKGDPSKFIIKYINGRIKKAGVGLSFFYLRYRTNIISIPAMTIDSNFIFNEVTNNYQAITLQGHFTYKINDPMKMATILDFSIDPKGKYYLSDDPEKLEFRIKNVVQMYTRNEIENMDLEEALTASRELAQKVIVMVDDSPIITEMGIDLLSITFTSIKPTPEISRALEADYRENLQMKADEAIYARRAAAVEQERKIKENELENQISLEKKNKTLIALQGENLIKEAEFKAKALKSELGAYKDMDERVLLSLALKEIAKNAEKIGNLTITSEILGSLLEAKKSKK